MNSIRLANAVLLWLAAGLALTLAAVCLAGAMAALHRSAAGR